MQGNFNWPLPILGSAGIGTANPCPKCGGRRTHSYSRSYPASPLDHDVIRCEICGYSEYLQEDGTYAPRISFDETSYKRMCPSGHSERNPI